MSSVVNLRLARKRKARAENERTASENRALHGRTLEEKRRDRLNAKKSAAFVDGHRRETGSDDETQ